MDPDEFVLMRYCMVCEKPSSVVVPKLVIVALSEGVPIQDAWPQATAEQRELVITGTHDTCYEQMTQEMQ